MEWLTGVAGLLIGSYSPAMPSPQLAVLVDMLRSAPPVPQDMDTATRRQRMEELTATAPLVDGVRTTAVEAGGVPSEWVETTGASPRGTILYLHGGGYTIGSVTTRTLNLVTSVPSAKTSVTAVRQSWQRIRDTAIPCSSYVPRR